MTAQHSLLVLPEELTHAEANACLPMLVQALPSQGSSARVDATALTRFDSSTLAVLLEFRKACVAAGKALELLHLNPRLAELARLYGVDDLLGIA
jgi:phospholipid transport system transporter-binding protein